MAVRRIEFRKERIDQEKQSSVCGLLEAFQSLTAFSYGSHTKRQSARLGVQWFRKMKRLFELSLLTLCSVLVIAGGVCAVSPDKFDSITSIITDEVMNGIVQR